LGACSCGGEAELAAVAAESPAKAATGVAAQAQGRVLIDVRTPEEVAEGALRGAANINLQGDFRNAVSELPRDEAYFVYCRTGNRSAQAVAIMAELGFVDVVDGGGFEDLVSAGLPRT
jgi:rhodanese-related sulfurtransferase